MEVRRDLERVLQVASRELKITANLARIVAHCGPDGGILVAHLAQFSRIRLLQVDRVRANAREARLWESRGVMLGRKHRLLLNGCLPGQLIDPRRLHCKL